MICHNTERPRFDRLAAYLMRTEPDRERVQWAGTRNLPTEEPELGAVFMQATASRNVRVQKPAYQMVVSFAPDDPVDRVLMECVADGLLQGLALGEHQALLVAHQGEPRPHLHMVVNRVHPDTGRAWSTWHAWSRTREALCDLEQALGLRALSAPLQVVHEVAQDVRLYERVLNLGSERHEAELNASAAQARWTRFELMAEQARTSRSVCDQAFARVFRDPVHAFGTFVAAASREGLPMATRRLREQPEQFGALLSVERVRALGLKHTVDDQRARSAVPAAAVAAVDALAASQAWHLAAQSTALGLEEAFERELGVLYHEPREARVVFERLASEQGAAHAAAVLRERPAEFGALRPAIQEQTGALSGQLARVVACGIEAADGRVEESTSLVRGAVPPRPLVGRGEVERAAERLDVLRSAGRALPSRSEVEERLGRALGRLSMREWRLLRSTLTAAHYGLAVRLRRSLRDVALGRGHDEERE